MYISYLASVVFKDSMLFPFTLRYAPFAPCFGNCNQIVFNVLITFFVCSLVGLSIMYGGIQYQKYHLLIQDTVAQMLPESSMRCCCLIVVITNNFFSAQFLLTCSIFGISSIFVLLYLLTHHYFETVNVSAV